MNPPQVYMCSPSWTLLPPPSPYQMEYFFPVFSNQECKDCISSVAQSCLTLCDSMDCSTPGLPVHHQLPELPQTHVHWVSDAILPSHPLSSPSPATFILSQSQGLFQCVSSLLQMAKVLEFQLQHQSLQWIFRTDFLWSGLIGSPCCPRPSRVFSNTIVQKHQFFGAKLFL